MSPGNKLSRRGGASASHTRYQHRLNSWVTHHRLSAADSLARLLDNPVSSLLACLVIGIALALPTAFNIALDNARQLSNQWDRSAQLSLFLHIGTSSQQIDEFYRELLERENIAEVVLVSREEALAEFSLLSGFADVLDSLDGNPLPDLLVVTPAPSAGSLLSLEQELSADPRVAETVLDTAWLERLNTLMELGRRVVLALGGVLLVGVLLILGNTIRLTIENRREEIVIVKLVGGSNGFVRRPFLYTGLWYGVGGGFFAALLVAAALWFLGEPVARLAELYQSRFKLGGLGIMGSLNLIVLGGLLGLSGAWLAVSRHLGQIAPR